MMYTHPRLAPAVDPTMKFHQVDRLADHLVLPGLASVVSRGCANTAETLAFVAVADERKLYLPAGYPSMYQYCVGELHMSEDATAKRIQAARVAREFPAIFDAVAEGRLHLSGVCLLAPHVNAEDADGWIAAAKHQSKSQIERLLAERFPKPDVPTVVMAIGPATSLGINVQGNVCENGEQHAPGHVGCPAAEHGVQSVPAPAVEHALQHVAAPAGRHTVAHVEPAAAPPRITPLTPQRFAWQLTVSGSTNDKLKYARELLGHAVPKGEIADVLDRALDALIEKLERSIFAAGSRTRPGRGSDDPRHVPAAVKHEVWVRDGGRCTFVSDKNHRCESRTRLQYDHVDPVARGGCATVAGMRLLCAAHNQHAAECTFGKSFMREKREAARRERHEARGRRAVTGLLPTVALELVPRLRELGLSPDAARWAATRAAEALPDATLEERIGYALELPSSGSKRRAEIVASRPG